MGQFAEAPVGVRLTGTCGGFLRVSTHVSYHISMSRANDTRKEPAKRAVEAITLADYLAAADALIDLRYTYTRRDGRPDITGTTYQYRQKVGELVSEAGVKASERSNVLAAIRYHVGNRLRERLSDEELEEWGLVKSSPRETSARGQARRAKFWGMTANSGEDIVDPEEALEAVMSATHLLQAIDIERRTLSDRQRSIYDMAVNSLRQEVDRL